jgi:hypothetical protein
MGFQMVYELSYLDEKKFLSIFPVSPVCARIWPDPGQIPARSGQILARIILKIFLMLLILNCDLI